MPSRLQVRKFAERLLSLGAISSVPVPVLQLAKLAGATVKRGPLPGDLSGFLLRNRDSTIIGVNSEHSDTRQRFTIAHELGHLLMHPQGNFVDRRFPIFFRDARSSSAEVRAEIEANQFAADLLMPRRMILGFVRGPIDIDDDEDLISRLAERFKVSPQAMVFRLTNLGLAEPAQSPSAHKRR